MSTSWSSTSARTVFPRLVIAGTAGDAGKTIVSLALLAAARRKGLAVRAFKKGPDYIDAAWLTWAAGSPARNLDLFLMGADTVKESFARNAAPDGFNLIEGNRGLYDGMDALGSASTAELAKVLTAPVVLVLNATKVTRSVAAWVLGFQKLDPDVRIAGVILNQVAGERHEQVMREAIQSACGIPVLGAIPRVRGDNMLPDRHLGLVTPSEHPAAADLAQRLLDRVASRLDIERLVAIARSVPSRDRQGAEPRAVSLSFPLTIAYLHDSAFTFYYPDNLEALEAAGARLIPFSSLAGTPLPADIHALYIGGGFPETHAPRLSANRAFLNSLRAAAASGLPIYAECGGLMLLSRAIWWQGQRHEMSGVLPFDVEVCATPQGHGYSVLSVDASNPFFAQGTTLRGHEFHYSRPVEGSQRPPTACAVLRGSGSFAGRDGVVVSNVWASYTHLHALGAPEWAGGFIRAAQRQSNSLHTQGGSP